MSGICSKHQGHDATCRLCVAVVRVQVDAESKAIKPVAERFERAVLVEAQQLEVVK